MTIPASEESLFHQPQSSALVICRVLDIATPYLVNTIGYGVVLHVSRISYVFVALTFDIEARSRREPFFVSHIEFHRQNTPFTPTLMCRFISTSGTSVVLALSIFIQQVLCVLYYLLISNTDDKLIPQSKTFCI